MLCATLLSNPEHVAAAAWLQVPGHTAVVLTFRGRVRQLLVDAGHALCKVFFLTQSTLLLLLLHGCRCPATLQQC
jgi:hypothetical protein